MFTTRKPFHTMFTRSVRVLRPAFTRTFATASLRTFPLVAAASATADSRTWHWRQGLIAATAAALGLSLYDMKTSEACGIVGFVGGDQDDASSYLLEGLTILQNRGYDSAGVATITPKSADIVTTKFASVGSTSDSVDLLIAKAPAVHKGDHLGIAHTRWATHGGKTDENAHPHSDSKGRVAIVHNGTIDNYQDLKKELLAKGYTFKGQTDTEVIANLIGSYLDTPGTKLLDAVKQTIARLSGTWGLCIIAKQEPDKIIVARNGSPLVVGIGQGKMFIASEHSAFRRHTGQYIALHDGEIAVVTPAGVSLDMARTQQAPKAEILLSPEPYKHWTIREIFEQPSAISRALNYGGRLLPDQSVKLGGLEDNKNVMTSISNLVISGCGTSLYAATYGAMLMRYVGAFDTVTTVDAAELVSERFPVSGAGLLVISQSGETLDVQRAINLAEELGVPRFSIINSVGSLIARTTKCGVYINAGREQAVASTKAFVTQVTVLALVAAWFAQQRDKPEYRTKRAKLVESIHMLPTYAGMTLNLDDQCKEIAQRLKEKEDIFVIGKGFGYPIAMEGALKIKEITYIHAEGSAAGALEHGNLALVTPETPVILVINEDKNQSFLLHVAEKLKARGAHLIVITDAPNAVRHLADEILVTPSNGPMTSLLSVIPLQLLAYHIADVKGINPDKPKNLAKAVTVD
jgi:glucosamine--fructose-6-phosphate aminotransferase (isomerizing)